MLTFVNFFTSNFYIEVFSQRYWDDVFKLSKSSPVEGIVEPETVSPLTSNDTAHSDVSFSDRDALQISLCDNNKCSTKHSCKED